ncbi:hypothetical protein PC128_g23311 [Phytophthora cactorum]|nr:hypothetical protein PC128_g23311 [Phytophthora cactorum]
MKLRVIFGLKPIVNGRQSVTRATDQTKDPSTLPLPELPAKFWNSEQDIADNVFSDGGNSAYFQRSVMVSVRLFTPARRLASDIDGSDDDTWDVDPVDEWERHMKAL